MKPGSWGAHETRLIGAPRDWNPARDGECRALSVHDMSDGHGHNMMVSRWELEPGDLEKLAAGEPLLLSIFGDVHPVVSISIGTPVADLEDGKELAHG